MPTTTNFGWTTPADTDLVKDGALAIRTLAGGIDTSMVGLKGGTTGQILSKTSGTDMAFTWINNDQGDLTAITAGTGISVTSGTGPIPTVAIDTATTVDKTTAQTLTNKTLTAPIISTISNTGTLTLPTSTDTLVGRATTDTLTNKTISASSNTLTGVINNTLTTTTGDIIYASSANTPARLGIGSTGQVLTVSGGIPSWGTASSTPTFVGVACYSSVGINISNNTATAMTWDSENFDSDGFHSTSSNTSRITIPSGKGGKYMVTAFGGWQSSSSGRRFMSIYKNGSLYSDNLALGASADSGGIYAGFSYLISLAAADYIEIYVQQNSGSTLNFGAGNNSGAFQVTYLGA